MNTLNKLFQNKDWTRRTWILAFCLQSSIFNLQSSICFAQDNLKTVTGQVTDAATGHPLAGVIVSAYGNQRHTAMTDEDGRYELRVPEQTHSVLLRVDGYNLQQQAISNDHADARLYSDKFRETYSRTTTATLSAKADRFDNTSELSMDPLLAQQLGADMRSISQGGNPGMGAMRLIEGLNSINANAQPLVVIDDVIMDMQYDRTMLHDGYFNNILANLNVNDIETVEVLKNGAALYGAKAANGVLVIKTKRNKSMATKIDVTLNGRYELVPRLPQMLGAEGYRLYATELLSDKMNPNLMGKMKFLNSEPNYYYYNQYHNNTDWTDETYRNAFSQNYGINVQGGDDAASYNLSVGYAMGNSTLKENDYTRFNMRLNSDIVITRRLGVRFDASYSDVDRSLRDDGAPQDPQGSVITSPGFLGLAKAPFLSPYAYDKYGNLSHYLAEADDYLEGKFQGRGSLANPVSILEHGDGKNRNSFGNRLVMFAITPKYEFNKHLALQEHFTLALVNTNENYYLPIQGVPNFYVKGLDEDTKLKNIVQSQASRLTTIQSDTRLTWNTRVFSGSAAEGNLKLMGGMRYLSNNYKLTSQRGYNSSNDKTPNMSGSLNFKSTGGADDKTREIAWYALADYSVNDRYYFNAGLSAQASSRFGDDASGLKVFGTVWGLFPSVEGAWVISNEPWFQAINSKHSILNYLRLNVGFDVTGNDDIDYTASRTYFIAKRMLSTSISSQEGTGVSGKIIGNIGNTDLQWETTRRITAGLNANLFDNRLHIGFNAYKSWTSNLLSLRQLAYTSGLSENWSNDGKLENSGFDVNLSAKILAKKDFTWELGASVGHYKNKVTALPDGDRSIETNIYGATILTQVGQPVGVFYGYKTDGVYATTADAQADGNYIIKQNGDRQYFQAGDMRFLDLSNSVSGGSAVGEKGLIDEADRTIIGDPNPDLYGNIFTSFSYKNLRLDATFNYSLGNDVYNYQRSLLEGGSLFINQTSALQNRWTTEGQQTDIPRVSYTDPMGNSRFSDRWIEDGSYLRLANVTLAWHLPLQSQYLQGITVWGSAQNLFTITRYLGSDPDYAMTGYGILSQGIDRGVLAAGRSFCFGVNINL